MKYDNPQTDSFTSQFTRLVYQSTSFKENESKPMWPMNAVSIREAIGSAAKARVVGSAIFSISKPNSSLEKAFLKA